MSSAGGLTVPGLDGAAVIATGGGSGIGAATARQLAAAGARVAVVGRRADRIKPLADEIGGLGLAVDVNDLAAVADTVRDQLGRPDLVVANAGVMLAAPFETADPGEWTQMIDTNIRGLVATGRAFADDLLAAAAAGKRADLIHVGSIGGHVVIPTYAVYGATKAAVAQLTRVLRAELGPRGVRVRAVEPGLTDTELGATMLDPDARAFLAGFRQRYASIPADDIATAITWSAALPARVNVAELIVLPTSQG
jgi:NADP-dependent 3-hydroxy acid dehydrogenase YdfG